MPGTTDLPAPPSNGPVRANSTDSFARFRQVAAAQPEKLRNMPALAKELGIAESTTYRYRQRLAQLAAAAETVSGPPDGTSSRPEPHSAVQQPDEEPGRLTPEEVDHEIAKILLMARRIRGFRRARQAVTDAEIAERLGIAIADIEKTVRFEQGYVEIERRLQQQKNQRDSGKLHDRRSLLP